MTGSSSKWKALKMRESGATRPCFHYGAPWLAGKSVFVNPNLSRIGRLVHRRVAWPVQNIKHDVPDEMDVLRDAFTAKLLNAVSLGQSSRSDNDPQTRLISSACDD